MKNCTILKPCPFCGNKPTLETSPYLIGCYKMFIKCYKCGAAGGSAVFNDETTRKKAEGEAIAKWNKREREGKADAGTKKPKLDGGGNRGAPGV